MVTLARMHYFGNQRSLDARLANAFAEYASWCKLSGVSSSSHGWSSSAFNMGKILLCNQRSMFHKKVLRTDLSFTKEWIPRELGQQSV